MSAALIAARKLQDDKAAGKKRKREKPAAVPEGEKVLVDAVATAEAEAAAAEEKARVAEEKAKAAEEAKEKKRLQAKEYLQCWEQRETLPWRFNKKLQQWWLTCWGSTSEVTKPEFATFTAYAVTISGAARSRLLDDARTAAAAPQDKEAAEGEDADPAAKAAHKKRIRAKKLVKALESSSEPAR